MMAVRAASFDAREVPYAQWNIKWTPQSYNLEINDRNYL